MSQQAAAAGGMAPRPGAPGGAPGGAHGKAALAAVLKPVLPLVLGASILMFGNSLLNLSTALKLDAAGVSAGTIGLVQSAFFFGFLFGCLLIKKLIRRVSHIRAYAVLGALAACTALLQALVFDTGVWIVARIIYGFAMAGIFTTIESWLNDRTSNETRGRVLTFYMASYYLAVGFGQVSINLWDLTQVLVLVFSGLAVILSLQPILLTNLPQPEVKSSKPMSVIALYRLSPLAVVGATGAGFLQSGLISMAPIFATQIGYSLLQVSLFTATLVIGPFLLLSAVGWLSDRIGRRAAIAIVLSLLAGIALLFYASHWLELHFGLVLVLGLLLGGGSSSVYPNAIAHAYDLLPKEQYVAASTSLLIYFSIGAILGPILAAWSMSLAGPHGLFLYSASFAFGLLCFVAYRWIVRPKVPVVSAQAFVPVSPTSRSAPQLDPRGARNGEGTQP
ncbi:MAG: MFS transporter [Pseudomonadota bacterium]